MLELYTLNEVSAYEITCEHRENQELLGGGVGAGYNSGPIVGK